MHDDVGLCPLVMTVLGGQLQHACVVVETDATLGIRMMVEHVLHEHTTQHNRDVFSFNREESRSAKCQMK